MAASKRLVRTLLVIFAIGAVFWVTFVYFLGLVIVDTKEEDARQRLMAIKLILIKSREERGRYPSEPEGLRSLVDPSPNGKYFPNEFFILDPWQHEVVYRPNKPPAKEGFLIYSLGPSGVDRGGQGDNIAIRHEHAGAAPRTDSVNPPRH